MEFYKTLNNCDHVLLFSSSMFVFLNFMMITECPKMRWVHSIGKITDDDESTNKDFNLWQLFPFSSVSAINTRGRYRYKGQVNVQNSQETAARLPKAVRVRVTKATTDMGVVSCHFSSYTLKTYRIIENVHTHFGLHTSKCLHTLTMCRHVPTHNTFKIISVRPEVVSV